jgi:sulfur carrier protein
LIELKVNGKLRTAEPPLTVLSYLEQLGINPAIVAVEYNGDIIRRERYGETPLSAGDVLEIVRMVGGGRL